jgi:hypothetical protein
MPLVLDRSTTTSPGNGPAATPTLTAATARRLRTANLAAAAFHLASAVLFLVLVTDFDLPITASYPTQDPALTERLFPPEVLTEVTTGYGVAAFSLLSAAFHLLVGTAGNATYNRAIATTQNPFRWIEYSLSSTLMIVLIIMLLGDYDIGALIGVAAANVSMVLFGWLMERHNTPGADDVDWYPFVFGCIAGIAPWIVGAVYFAGALGNADEAVPTWVWALFISVFVLFNCFAVNQFLQYRGTGRWRNYVFGEGVYIGLSFVAKTALMWQVYFGTVR